MLCSMTGYGEASYQAEDLHLVIELRSVNNRYLKVSLRAGEPYNLLEPEFEKVIRRVVRRGTIQAHFRCQRRSSPQDFQINAVALQSYVRQLRELAGTLGLSDHGQSLLSQVLALPGVVPEPATASFQMEEEWPRIEQVLEQALERLQAMRQEEGRAMAQELLQMRGHIAAQLELIRAHIPRVAVLYRDRLFDRVRTLLSEHDVQIDRSDLIKEVAIFAERSDIAEEVVRLASHLDQFQEIVNEPESAGRKLEFLTQEMFRETNTIGSKASDVEISRHVVEIKGTLEKIRELVQNVE
ncbi:MAG TPA: YicC/YloC family endoribonuclease [Gemmataceae bacterium]|nr:YicC/YloC family endoribonuclease [Gemmataceae bacterium]